MMDGQDSVQMHSGSGKTFGVMVVVCSPPWQEEAKHMQVLADLHRVVAKLKSGGREGWANGIAGRGQSGIALMLSPTHQQGVMPEPGITCSGGQEIERCSRPLHGWLLVRSIFGGAPCSRVM